MSQALNIYLININKIVFSYEIYQDINQYKLFNNKHNTSQYNNFNNNRYQLVIVLFSKRIKKSKIQKCKIMLNCVQKKDVRINTNIKYLNQILWHAALNVIKF